MSIKKMQRILYTKCGLNWLDYYYECLNKRYDLNWAIIECYNKFIVNG